MNTATIKSFLPVLLRAILGGVFFWSGFQKLMHLELFYQTAQNYEILTPQITQAYAGWLPWLEILGGLCLLLGLFTRFGAVVIGSLLVSFLIAVGWVLLRGDAIDCGCFLNGTQPSPVTWDLWIRDLLMLGGAVYLAYQKQPGRWSLDARLEKNAKAKTILISVIAVYCFITSIAALYSEIPKKPEPPVAQPLLEPGTLAPDFTMRDLDGKEISLQEYRNKKAVLIEIFATWCPHCQHSVPLLEKLHKTHGDKLQILAVNAGDQPGSPSTGAAFRATYQIGYPILEDPSMAMLDAYRVVGFPTLYLVDKSGHIVWNHTGTVEAEDVAEIEKRLGD